MRSIIACAPNVSTYEVLRGYCVRDRDKLTLQQKEEDAVGLLLNNKEKSPGMFNGYLISLSGFEATYLRNSILFMCLNGPRKIRLSATKRLCFARALCGNKHNMMLLIQFS